jgi:hypothetical protein
VRLGTIGRGGEALHEGSGRSLDDLGIDRAQAPARAPCHDEQGPDGAAVVHEGAGQGAAARPARALEALDLGCARRLQHLLEQQTALWQRLAAGEPGLRHRDGALGIVAVAQEERGVIDLEDVGDPTQLDGGEVREARAGADVPIRVALRRVSARPADVIREVMPPRP